MVRLAMEERQTRNDVPLLAMVRTINAARPSMGPCTTVAATRPNRERRNPFEFPFSHLALAIRDENHQKGGCDALNGREKVPVPAVLGNSQ
jgi:hypothetical protein